MLEQKLMNITNEFKNNTSKLTKESLLVKYKDDEDFKKYLFYVLDSLNVYGIQDKKLKKHLGKSSEGRGNKNLFDVFEYLLKHNTGTDKDAQIVARFINSFEDEDVKAFLLESFTKKIKMGMTANTVNKVYGKGFISKFDVQLAHPYDKIENKIIGKEFVLTEKLDGMRVFSIVENGSVKLFTRDGKLKTGFTEIESELSTLKSGCYDGEMIIASHEELSDRDVLQQTLKITQKDGEKKGLLFVIFDYVSLEEFKDSKGTHDYFQRREILENVIPNSGFKHLQLIDILYKGSDTSVIPEMVANMDAKGREGLMLNVISAPYEFKRSNNLAKIKTFLNFESSCIDIFEGEGKYKGMLGGIIVEYKDYTVRVGSGFNDEQRKYYFENPNEIIGNIVEVQYFRESKNEQGELSVSFPVFVSIRKDKTEASYN